MDFRAGGDPHLHSRKVLDLLHSAAHTGSRHSFRRRTRRGTPSNQISTCPVRRRCTGQGNSAAHKSSPSLGSGFCRRRRTSRHARLRVDRAYRGHRWRSSRVDGPPIKPPNMAGNDHCTCDARERVCRSSSMVRGRDNKSAAARRSGSGNSRSPSTRTPGSDPRRPVDENQSLRPNSSKGRNLRVSHQQDLARCK